MASLRLAVGCRRPALPGRALGCPQGSGLGSGLPAGLWAAALGSGLPAASSSAAGSLLKPLASYHYMPLCSSLAHPSHQQSRCRLACTEPGRPVRLSPGALRPAAVAVAGSAAVVRGHQPHAGSRRSLIAARAAQELDTPGAEPPPGEGEEEDELEEEGDPPEWYDDEGIALLNEMWGIPGAIMFIRGPSGLPSVLIKHPQTHQQLEVCLQGAAITQWRKVNGTSTFLEPSWEEHEQPGVPIRAGVSVHFPQHREGLLPEHGFAGQMMWEVVGAGFDCPDVLAQLHDMSANWEDLQRRMAGQQQEGEEAEEGQEAEAGAATASAGEEEAEEEAEGEEEAEAEGQEEGQEAGEGEGEAEGEDGYEFPLPVVTEADLAPYVVLRLRDSPATRAMWPHKFTLLYKITLENQDDLTAEDIKDIGASYGEKVDIEEYEEEEELLITEEEDLLAADDYTQEEEEGGTGAGAGEEAVTSGRRARRAAAEEVEQEREVPNEVDEEGASGADEGLAGMAGITSQDPIKPATQVRQEFWLFNKDEPGSEPLSFNLGTLAHIKTMDQGMCSDWVKVLGLGGTQVFDYTSDPRYPSLGLNLEDFLHFDGARVDRTYIDVGGATVYMCPGNRSHFEFVLREGFRDMWVDHPGADADPEYVRATAIGMGYVAAPKRLPAGECFVGESVLRYHDRYWVQPIFGDDSPPPLEPIPREQLLADRNADGGASGGGDVAGQAEGAGAEEADE